MPTQKRMTSQRQPEAGGAQKITMIDAEEEDGQRGETSPLIGDIAYERSGDDLPAVEGSVSAFQRLSVVSGRKGG